jgi:hypothetical protein
MITNMKLKISIVLISLTIISILTSCTKDDNAYKVGESFDNSDATIGYSDKLSCSISTVMLDSMITSKKKKIFFGYNIDPVLGSICANSYIPLTKTTSFIIDEEAIYDSIIIYFKPDGTYAGGDTLAEKTINIYQVTEEITPTKINYSENLFSNNSFAYNPKPLTSITFLPRPMGKKIVRGHLPDSLGQLWFNKLQDDTDPDMKTSELFLQYFKGIVVIPQTKDKKWSMTFVKTSSSNSQTSIDEADIKEFEVRIYYRIPSSETEKYYSFQIPSDSYLFTNFIADRTNTIIENIHADNTKLSSDKTANTSFIQAGGGLILKVDIPSIEEIFSINPRISILDAKLIIRPLKKTYDDINYPLPQYLYTASTDYSNDIMENLFDISGNLIIGSLDEEDSDDPYYTFNVTKFIRDKLNNVDQNSDAILITLSEDENATSFTRLIIADQELSEDDVVLKLYYLTY